MGERLLTLEQGGQQQIQLLSAVTVSDALGSIPLTLTFADGGRFVPEDDAAFCQWWQQRHCPGLVHRLEQHRRGVGLTLLATLAAIALYVGVILPAVSSVLARHIPSYVERQVGQQTFTLLHNSGFSSGQLTPGQLKRMKCLFAATVPAEVKDDPMPLRGSKRLYAGGRHADYQR